MAELPKAIAEQVGPTVRKLKEMEPALEDTQKNCGDIQDGVGKGTKRDQANCDDSGTGGGSMDKALSPSEPAGNGNRSDMSVRRDDSYGDLASRSKVLTGLTCSQQQQGKQLPKGLSKNQEEYLWMGIFQNSLQQNKKIPKQEKEYMAEQWKYFLKQHQEAEKLFQ